MNREFKLSGRLLVRQMNVTEKYGNYFAIIPFFSHSISLKNDT